MLALEIQIDGIEEKTCEEIEDFLCDKGIKYSMDVYKEDDDNYEPDPYDEYIDRKLCEDNDR